jgi:hypothetical protein
LGTRGYVGQAADAPCEDSVTSGPASRPSGSILGVIESEVAIRALSEYDLRGAATDFESDLEFACICE